jgi:hypothetical protein
MKFKTTVFFLFLHLICFSQKTVPLKQILTEIEKQHRLKFNYLDQDVTAVFIVEPNKNLNLNQKLKEITTQTNLSFEIVNSEFIIIKSTKKTLVDTTNNAVDLSSNQKLEEVVIKNYIANGISKKLDGTFEIKPKKFGLLPGLSEPDVLQTLQQIPGINSNNESVSDINVRGGTTDQNVFLWNGIKMFQTGHFFGLISAFNPTLANKIKVYRNGTSAFFGDSVSAVVAISTQSDSIENSNNNVNINLINGAVYSKIKLSKKASLEFSGRRALTDFAQSITYEKYYERIFEISTITTDNVYKYIGLKPQENFYFYDYTAQYHQKVGNESEFLINLIGVNNRLSISQNYDIEDKPESNVSDLKQRNFGGSVFFKTKFNPKNKASFEMYGSTYNLIYDTEGFSNNDSRQTNDIQNFGFRMQNKTVINPYLVFNSGLQYDWIKILNSDKDINLYKNIQSRMTSFALISEFEFKPKNTNLFLNAGLRLNYYKNFSKTILEPRLQLNYSITENLSLEIQSEQKSQTITQIINFQDDFLGIETGRWIVTNNNDYPIMRNNQIAAGFIFKKKEWFFTIESFYKKVNGISIKSQGFQYKADIENTVGSYTNKGFETLIQRNSKKFITWISYAFNDNNHEFDVFNPKKFINNNAVAHSLSFAGTYNWENLKIAFGGKYHTGKSYTKVLDFEFNQETQAINFDSPNTAFLPSYVQFNFSSAYLWELENAKKLELSLSILNVFNTKSIVNRYYRVNNLSQQIEQIDIFSLKLTPNINLKYSF